MIPQEAIEEEALRRYNDDVDGQTGASVDDWGYSECQRRAFVAGALFASTEARAAELEAANETLYVTARAELRTADSYLWPTGRRVGYTDGIIHARSILRDRTAAIRAEES